jgi:aconitate hydratase
MAENLARKLIDAHLVDGNPVPWEEIALRVDQVLTHDANGPLCAVQLEAMGVTEIRSQLAVVPPSARWARCARTA